jgi:hypothetical protein
MKTVLTTLTLIIALFSCTVFAHSEHAQISAQQAIKLAVKSANKMTFKDVGFEVGKLDSSWKNVTESNTAIESVDTGYFIVKANNTTLNTIIYFKITLEGQVLDVSKKGF